MRTSFLALSAGLLSLSAPALAQEEAPAIVISGTAGLTSDYRFRGVSLSDRDPAVQAGITLTHKSGLYGGVWGSNLAGWGTFGGPNLELDVIAGYKTAISDGVTIDVGATWYMYPSGADTTDFIEPYIKLSGTAGPVGLTAGVAYAPKQEALGRFFRNAAEAGGPPTAPGDKEDNLYVWGDAVSAIPGTPFTLKAHIGYSEGNDGLGPRGTSVAPTGEYLDWSVGVDTTWRNLTLGISYVDTDISNAERLYLAPNFGANVSDDNPLGDNIGAGTFVVSLTAAF
jgi:hypothetical protein